MHGNNKCFFKQKKRCRPPCGAVKLQGIIERVNPQWSSPLAPVVTRVCVSVSCLLTHTKRVSVTRIRFVMGSVPFNVIVRGRVVCQWRHRWWFWWWEFGGGLGVGVRLVCITDPGGIPGCNRYRSRGVMLWIVWGCGSDGMSRIWREIYVANLARLFRVVLCRIVANVVCVVSLRIVSCRVVAKFIVSYRCDFVAKFIVSYRCECCLCRIVANCFVSCCCEIYRVVSLWLCCEIYRVVSLRMLFVSYRCELFRVVLLRNLSCRIVVNFIACCDSASGLAPWLYPRHTIVCHHNCSGLVPWLYPRHTIVCHHIFRSGPTALPAAFHRMPPL